VRAGRHRQLLDRQAVVEQAVLGQLLEYGPALVRVLAGEGAAPEQVALLHVHHVGGQALPEPEEHPLLAVLQRYARPTDLDRVVEHLLGQALEFELAVRVEAAVPLGHRPRLHAVRADDLVGLGVLDDQVMAACVEGVLVAAADVRLLEPLAQL